MHNLPPEEGYTHEEKMLYDLKTKSCICPKCGSGYIAIFPRPVESIYECTECGFNSVGTITIIHNQEVEHYYGNLREDW